MFKCTKNVPGGEPESMCVASSEVMYSKYQMKTNINRSAKDTTLEPLLAVQRLFVRNSECVRIVLDEFAK